MARVGIVFGVLLCGLTFAGLVGTNVKHPGQFFPMMLGIPILFCGVVGLNPHRRKHAVHVIAAIALLGVAAAGSSVIISLALLARRGSIGGYRLALGGSTLVVCLTLLTICVSSFVVARRRRETSDPDEVVKLHPAPSPPSSPSTKDSRESA